MHSHVDWCFVASSKSLLTHCIHGSTAQTDRERNKEKRLKKIQSNSAFIRFIFRKNEIIDDNSISILFPEETSSCLDFPMRAFNINLIRKLRVYVPSKILYFIIILTHNTWVCRYNAWCEDIFYIYRVLM